LGLRTIDSVPHVTEILPGQRIVEVTLSGALDDPEAIDMLVESRKLQAELDIPDALLDCTYVIKGLSYSSVVEMADYIVALGVPSDWRQAVVKPKDLTAAVTIGLWEAAGNNRGMSIRVFPDRESALVWLTATT
jgi:hypothetical protein